MLDFRGKYNKDLAKRNREKILEFIKKDKDCSQIEIARALGFAPYTVAKHVKAIKEQGLLDE